jgi:hypothetical protein
MLNDVIKLTFVQELELNSSGDVTTCGITNDLGSKGTAIDKGHCNVLLGDIWRKIGDIQEWIAEVWMRMSLDGLGIVKGIHGRGMDASVLHRESADCVRRVPRLDLNAKSNPCCLA